MKFAYCHGSFCALAAAVIVLLTPGAVSRARAQNAAQAATAPQSAQPSAPAEMAKTAMSPAGGAAIDRGGPPQPKSLTAKAIDKVKEVAKSAGDIFSRVPCLPPKGGTKSMGSLPHVARKLASGQPVVIVAFGSSSTAGYGASGPEFNYPNRLAVQLRRQYPSADISVINAGRGGEDAPEMIKRLQTSVIDAHPDLVIWQVGTNAVLRNLDPTETVNLVEDGAARHRAWREREQDGEAARQGRRTASCRDFPALRGDARLAREAGAADRQFRDRRRLAHERLGLCLLRATARRRHHRVSRPDQARRQRAVERAGLSADVIWANGE